MIENLQALNDNVLVAYIEKEEKVMESGIIITGKSVNDVMKNMRRGKVLSIGAKVKSELNEGSVIWFQRFVGSEVGEEHVLLKEDQILAVEK